VSPVDRDPAALREQAVTWFNLQRSGDMTGEDARRLAEWLDGSDDARRAYERLRRQWRILGAVADEPEILAQREEDAKAYHRSPQTRRFWMAAAAAALVFFSSTTAYHAGLLGDLGPGRGGGETLVTGTGQRMTTVLADGSVITLDAESELKVLEMAARRRIELVHGRAFFKVAKDRLHPFLVQAAGKTVHAIGTQFDVRVDHEDVTVTLVEGKVRVDQSNLFGVVHSAEMLKGGQLVADRGRDWKLTQIDADREVTWTSGRLTFFHDPLSTALDEINRYSEKKVVFVGGKVPDTQIVGVFQAGDIDAFVTALELNGIAHVVSRSGDTIEVSTS
jgi:transmembrane sensor